MRKITRTTLLAFLLMGIHGSLSAQDIIDKLSNELCKCAEKNKVESANEMEPCFEDVLISNLNKIKKYYEVETIDEVDMDEVSSKIGAKIIKECPYILDIFPSGVVGDQEKVNKPEDLKCDDLKNGDYYYLTQRPENRIFDTTYVTISNNMFLERMKNGKTYSLLNIEWKDNCEFDLIFKESNDPLKKEISKTGDKYEYEILTNSSKSVFLKTNWMKRSYQFELFKIK